MPSPLHMRQKSMQEKPDVFDDDDDDDVDDDA